MDPSFRALSGRPEFTVRRDKSNNDPLYSLMPNECVLSGETQLLDLPTPGLLPESEQKGARLNQKCVSNSRKLDVPRGGRAPQSDGEPV